MGNYRVWQRVSSEVKNRSLGFALTSHILETDCVLVVGFLLPRRLNKFMNKIRKIIISVYIAVCFLIFLALLLWYFKFNQFLLDAFLWGKYSGDYSNMDFLLYKMLFSDILSWIILAVPTIFLYKHWGDNK